MRSLASLATLLFGSFVSAQNNYSALPVEYLLTSTPVTPLPQGFPWGDKTANNTNPYTNAPNTGVIRSYDFTVQRGKASPDGYERDVILVNGVFPGPLIEANWGDTIQVTVHNQITGPEEGTALHWHGLLQKQSQWFDGVPGVQQCPIPPGGSFTYTFLADLYGTSWWHSHYSAQYNAGIFGPMIIHGPATVPYDIDLGPILLTDWYHPDYFSLVEDVVSTNITRVLVTSDSNLIQGKGFFNCSTKATTDAATCNDKDFVPPTFKLTPGRRHRLRLINAGTEGTQKFAIDGHTMTVIANDFVPILPYTTEVVTLGVGQRTDVIVQALPLEKSGSYWMRSTLAGCALTSNPAAKAVAYYGSRPNLNPTTTASGTFNNSVANVCANDPLTKTIPWYPIIPDPNPPTTEHIDIEFGQNSTGNWQWTMNNSSFRANYNHPLLLLSNQGNNSYPDSPEWNVYNFGSNSSFRIYLTNPLGVAHPIHLHGHNMFVLNEGLGTWDGHTVVRPINPQRRDVHILQGAGYMVLQVTADNPGVWPLHCHIAFHVSSGLYVNVVERPADIANLKIPSIMAQTCRDWSLFTNSTVVDQIDSGL
ncbi:16abb2c0-1552-4ace-bf14-beaeb00daa69 [Sclerotinia trifoliorum]|uniref:laccase n=1 Tax=Sclerotinia trifoliorum TaxID=28548 RepID=A0A8H2VZL3_9HELO|nr:16abb2c0-1552-4ace-bf14-beaeb00daa69 [Sclerotinia trifoliorum]